jgi:hypothetical protein
MPHPRAAAQAAAAIVGPDPEALNALPERYQALIRRLARPRRVRAPAAAG